MSSLSSRIDAILAQRHNSVKLLGPIISTLSEAEESLVAVRQFVAEHRTRFDIKTQAEFSALESDVSGLYDQVREQQETLRRLLARFERPTLNVGVAGTARQGKSTLLQSLSGLSDGVIPSGSKSHCTGAPCVITNSVGPVHARISFHTERSFLVEVVRPFCEQLMLPSDLGTIDAFAKLSLQRPKRPGEDGYGESEGIWNRLRELQTAVPHFRHNLGKEDLEIGEPEIRNYVAQEDQRGVKLHAWHSVKLANVFCTFPQKELGKVTLLDTPGLGDFHSGAERRLMSTLAERFDVVLFVRRPDEHSTIVTKEDINFFALVGQAIPDLDPADWSFLVLNRVGNNEKQFDDYLKNLRKEANARTKDVFRLSCQDAAESRAMFQNLVELLVASIQKLDRQYAESRLAPIRELGTALESFAQRIAKVLPEGGRALATGLFNNLFRQLWQDTSHSLVTLLDEYYRPERGKADSVFAAELQRVCGELEKGPNLPALEQIKKEAAAGGQGAWHEDKMHELRNQMCRAFLTLDERLNARFEELRDKVRHILEGAEGGRLGNLISTADRSQWWGKMSDKWAEFEGSESIIQAIAVFAEAGLTIRGFMLPRIRNCMDVLDRNSPEAAAFVLPAGEKAEKSVERLTVAWERAAYQVTEAAKKFEVEPSNAQFAALEEFLDAILRGDGRDRMKERWAVFYQEYRGEVWPDQFDDIERTAHLRLDWKRHTGTLRLQGATLQHYNVE